MEHLINKKNALELAKFLKMYKLVESTNEGMRMITQGAVKYNILYKDNIRSGWIKVIPDCNKSNNS